MLFGQYNQKTSYEHFLTNPVWKNAFDWIRKNGHTLPDGEHTIEGRDIYANIQSIQTTPIQDALFEVHEKYIDIHYCLSGGELIGYAPVGKLIEKELNTEKDYQLFLPTKAFRTYIMRPDDFAIFFPGEYHMPKLQNGINQDVKKVVIKIKASMLRS